LRPPSFSSRTRGLIFVYLLLLPVVLAGHGPLVAADEKPERPPVRVEKVKFRHGRNVLAGDLYLPTKPGPHPAIGLVLGSGAQDRTYGGVGPALGNDFARLGFACLAWDKPGVGESTGDFHAQTFRDRAEESLAALDFLRARDDIRPDRVGLWGHSQGGMIAPLAASLSHKVAFLIDVAGWQGPAWRQDQIRVEAEMRADNCPPKDIAQAVAFAKTRMDLIRGTEPFEVLDKKQQAVKGAAWIDYVHLCDEALYYSARRIVHYDSAPWWEDVHCPVLVLYGDKDTSSGSPEPLIAIIRRGLAKAGNPNVEVKIFANADHSLRQTQTGGPKEARERAQARKKGDPQFVDGYLSTMRVWLEKQARR
jgi:pimeloyl-ACP methyl ester carboxylesterase